MDRYKSGCPPSGSAYYLGGSHASPTRLVWEKANLTAKLSVFPTNHLRTIVAARGKAGGATAGSVSCYS